MNIHKDFEEFLKLLTAEEVEFVIVGGYAVAFHGYIRATNDIDFFFGITPENIRKICDALEHFGIPVPEANIQNFSEPGAIIRIGTPPVQIEMINNISGLSFEEVWSRRVESVYGETSVGYISLADLLKNKKASGRPKDLADVDELGGEREKHSEND